MNELSCPVCAATDLVYRFRLRTQYLDRSEMYSIYSCRGCEFSFASGRCDEHFLSAIYTAGFHDSAQQRADTGAKQRYPVGVNATARAAWLHARGWDGALLDIGAGQGVFVLAASRYSTARGIEISEQAAAGARARGAHVATGDFLAPHGVEGRYDVITLWDVLASLRDPHAAVARIAALLAPGGRAVFTVPIATSWVARATGRYWPMWIPPVNLGYYSERSARILLERHGLILECFEFRSKRVAVSFALEKLMRSIGLHALLPLAHAIPAQWQVPLNLRDIATVVAIKPKHAAS